MANFAQPIHNPIDDPTLDELFADAVALNICAETEDPDSFEPWQLERWIKDAKEEMAAQDYFASRYSF